MRISSARLMPMPLGGQDTIMTALAKEGIFLRSDCSGNGTCHKCKVSVSPEGSTEEDVVLACRTNLRTNITIDISEESLEQPGSIDKGQLQLPKKYLSPKRRSSEDSRYGVAVDLGTTTVGLYLVDLTEQKYMAGLSFKNPQHIFGSDVISRISEVIKREAVLGEMQLLIVNGLETFLKDLLEKNLTSLRRVEKVLVAGNPTMIHILLNRDPRSIGVSPYQPRFKTAQRLTAGAVGFKAEQELPFETLPLISGFLGSDILSSALAIDLLNLPSGSLLIDLGTNGEIMLKGEESIYATSCATGPAFEGASLACGMTAVTGAIYRADISAGGSSVSFQLISDGPNKPKKALGICGSGVVSAISSLLEAGILQADGRFSDTKVANLSGQGADKKFMLAQPQQSGNPDGIFLTQKDVRAIQMAKAAIMAGIRELCSQAGISAPSRIYLAGAFGNYIDPDEMIEIGMLPLIDCSDIRMVGNAAGAGTVLCLLDRKSSETLDQIIHQTVVVDLNSNPEFHQDYIRALGF